MNWLPKNVSPREPAAVVGLLMLFVILAVSASATKCTTFDEQFHLTGGYSYWTLNDFRIQPENGNLPQRWMSLPLLVGNCRFPPTTSNAWKRSDMFAVGDAFFYDLGDDLAGMLFSAREM